MDPAAYLTPKNRKEYSAQSGPWGIDYTTLCQECIIYSPHANLSRAVISSAGFGDAQANILRVRKENKRLVNRIQGRYAEVGFSLPAAVCELFLPLFWVVG